MVSIIANNTNMTVSVNENLERQNSGRHRYFEKIVHIESQNQVIGKNTDDRGRDAVDSAVNAVENRMHDAISTALNDVVIARVEMAVRSITGSSGIGPSSKVQNLDRIDFTGRTEKTPLSLVTSRLDLNIDQDSMDETRDIDNSEDGDFPTASFNYDRRTHAHYIPNSLNFQSVKKLHSLRGFEIFRATNYLAVNFLGCE